MSKFLDISKMTDTQIKIFMDHLQKCAVNWVEVGDGRFVSANGYREGPRIFVDGYHYQISNADKCHCRNCNRSVAYKNFDALPRNVVLKKLDNQLNDFRLIEERVLSSKVFGHLMAYTTYFSTESLEYSQYEYFLDTVKSLVAFDDSKISEFKVTFSSGLIFEKLQALKKIFENINGKCYGMECARSMEDDFYILPYKDVVAAAKYFKHEYYKEKPSCENIHVSQYEYSEAYQLWKNEKELKDSVKNISEDKLEPVKKRKM